MKDDTKIVTAGRHPHENYGVVNPPVYHASTILAPTLQAREDRQKSRQAGVRTVAYGRSGTPTTFALEDAVNAVEGGDRCNIFSSGAGAVAAVLIAYVESGDHILVADNVYGPTRRFCDGMLARFGVETTYYNPAIGAAGVNELMRARTKLVYAESPGSLTFEMMDFSAVAEVAHKHGAFAAIDNTWASPLYYKPFEHGADISIQAGTKYIVGHSDVMIVTVATTEEAYEQLRQNHGMLGQTAGPDDAYLAQRGFRTLSVRMARHWENGIRLAEWLAAQPEVETVMHPALPDDPGHELWKRDFSGASGLFGVTLKPTPRAALEAMIDNLELYGIGSSWGGYESLVILTDPNAIRTTAAKWPHPGPTLRFHAGLEDGDDLIADLDAGFGRLRKAL
jgi:cystathionine beta-lyase